MTTENPLAPQTIEQSIDLDTLPTDFPIVSVGDHDFMISQANQKQEEDGSIKIYINTNVVGENDPNCGMAFSLQYTVAGGKNPNAAKVGQTYLGQFCRHVLGPDAKGKLDLNTLVGRMFRGRIKHTPSSKTPGKMFPNLEKLLPLGGDAGTISSPV